MVCTSVRYLKIPSTALQLHLPFGLHRLDERANKAFISRSSLSASASILSNNLQSLTDHMSKHADLFSRTVVYPSTNFPGRTQEGLLGQLLRKKLEPQVESWVEEGRTIEKDAETTVAGENLNELWKWADEWMGQRVMTYVTKEAGSNYTLEEREAGIENVNTGLRRKFDEEEEGSDDEDEDEDMEDGEGTMEVVEAGKDGLGQVEFEMGKLKKTPDGTSRSVDDILRFATTGIANR